MGLILSRNFYPHLTTIKQLWEIARLTVDLLLKKSRQKLPDGYFLQLVSYQVKYLEAQKTQTSFVRFSYDLKFSKSLGFSRLSFSAIKLSPT